MYFCLGNPGQKYWSLNVMVKIKIAGGLEGLFSAKTLLRSNLCSLHYLCDWFLWCISFAERKVGWWRLLATQLNDVGNMGDAVCALSWLPASRGRMGKKPECGFTPAYICLQKVLQKAEVAAYTAGTSSFANEHGKSEQLVSPSTPFRVYRERLLNASNRLPHWNRSSLHWFWWCWASFHKVEMLL